MGSDIRLSSGADQQFNASMAHLRGHQPVSSITGGGDSKGIVKPYALRSFAKGGQDGNVNAISASELKINRADILDSLNRQPNHPNPA